MHTIKVLHVTPAYYPATYWGGPIFSVYALNNALAELPDLVLKVITTDSAGPKISDRLRKQNIINENFNHEVIFCKRIAGASMSFNMLIKMIPLIKSADVVHLTATYSFPTIPTLIICRLLGKPIVWSPRGAILDAYEWEGTRNRGIKRAWDCICNFIVRPGKTVLHVTSEGERRVSLDRISRARAVIVPNGVQTLLSFPKREWLPEGRLRLIFMGRLSPKKGVENLLKAMKLMEVDKTIELTIYGTGEEQYQRSLMVLATDLGLLGQSVQFAGHVDDNDKRDAFLNADICVVPSYTENFCMVVAEALGHGVPVITSYGTPWAEIEAKKCGMWIENTPEILAKSIYDMRKLDLKKMGRAGWDWMTEDYSWDVVSKKISVIYRGLL